MTYDDWKAHDDTPEPEPNRCGYCGHPDGYCDCRCCTEPPVPSRLIAEGLVQRWADCFTTALHRDVAGVAREELVTLIANALDGRP